MRTAHYAGAGGLQLAADVWDGRREPYILFIPGGGQTRGAWRRTAVGMAAKGSPGGAPRAAFAVTCAWAPMSGITGIGTQRFMAHRSNVPLRACSPGWLRPPGRFADPRC
jgi:pimeloyl-ACP methyl ester carboxylesterase